MPFEVIDDGEDIDLDEFDKAIGRMLQRAANIVRLPLSQPPPKKTGQKHLAGPLPGGFYTNRQRAYVMLGVKTGIIEVPYIRTGNLPRSWSLSEPEKDGKDLIVTVFSDQSEAPYNEWVQQDDPKADRQRVPMHEDWPAPNEVADKHEKEVVKYLENEMKAWGAA